MTKLQMTPALWDELRNIFNGKYTRRYILLQEIKTILKDRTEDELETILDVLDEIYLDITSKSPHSS